MPADLNYQLACLTVYRSLLDDPVMQALRGYLSNLNEVGPQSVTAADDFHRMAYLLLTYQRSLGEHLLNLIACDDNPFSRQAEMGGLDRCPPALRQAVSRDLRILQKVSQTSWVTGREEWIELEPLFARSGIGPEPALSDCLAAGQDWGEELAGLAAHYRRNSRGIVSRYRALRWSGRGLEGIDHPDTPRMEDLVGYESQKEQILANTRQFVQGFPANNTLLYGSRGTGKSTMVKTLLHEFRTTNLRLVEVQRDQLEQLPQVVAALTDYRPPFIIFIDDLSFEDYETGYKGLKAVMEGGLQRQPLNVLIYATSNRRHLVKEYFTDRSGPGEEIHTQDTRQEKLSLSDRFGLTLTFPAPGQQLYLQMVKHLLRQRGLIMDDEPLLRRALEWERAHHGVSGRTARQFVDSLGGG